MPPTIKRSQFPERLRKTKFFSHYSPFHKLADLSTVFYLSTKMWITFTLFSPQKRKFHQHQDLLSPIYKQVSHNLWITLLLVCDFLVPFLTNQGARIRSCPPLIKHYLNSSGVPLYWAQSLLKKRSFRW